MLPVLQLLRPHQWTKNLLVFAALLATRRYSDTESVRAALLAFASFCLLSSATYVFNDWLDRERDKAHHRKRRRPIASGKVSGGAALFIGIVCVAGGLELASLVDMAVFYYGIGYLAIQVLYNFGLKYLAVADVFTISTGFVLRAVVGAVAINVSVSHWLYFCTGAFALYLGFAKRRAEALSSGDQAGDTREVLQAYGKQTLDALVLLFSGLTVISYGLYAIESETALRYPLIGISAVWVAYAVCRYLVLAFNDGEGEAPDTLLFRDPQLAMCLVLFIASLFFAMQHPVEASP